MPGGGCAGLRHQVVHRRAVLAFTLQKTFQRSFACASATADVAACTTGTLLSRSFVPGSSAPSVRTARRRWRASTARRCSRSTPPALWSSTVAEDHRQLVSMQLRQLARRHEGRTCPWCGGSGCRAAKARGGPPACYCRRQLQKELLAGIYRRSARCLRALAATPKPARALGPSCIALTGASPCVSCRASSVYVPLMWGSLSPGCAPEVALQRRAWSM